MDAWIFFQINVEDIKTGIVRQTWHSGSMKTSLSGPGAHQLPHGRSSHTWPPTLAGRVHSATWRVFRNYAKWTYVYTLSPPKIGMLVCNDSWFFKPPVNDYFCSIPISGGLTVIKCLSCIASYYIRLGKYFQCGNIVKLHRCQNCHHCTWHERNTWPLCVSQ